MAVTRHIVKSCCSSKSFVFETDKPIKKTQLKKFEEAGYIVPPSFVMAGIFYIRGNGLIATASFGAKKISVRCTGDKCSEKMDAFAMILDIAVNQP